MSSDIARHLHRAVATPAARSTAGTAAAAAAAAAAAEGGGGVPEARGGMGRTSDTGDSNRDFQAVGGEGLSSAAGRQQLILRLKACEQGGRGGGSRMRSQPGVYGGCAREDETGELRSPIRMPRRAWTDARDQTPDHPGWSAQFLHASVLHLYTTRSAW